MGISDDRLMEVVQLLSSKVDVLASHVDTRSNSILNGNLSQVSSTGVTSRNDIGVDQYDLGDKFTTLLREGSP